MTVDADEALRIGLVNTIVPLPELEKTAMEMAGAVRQINEEHRAKGIPEIGVDIFAPDFVAVAKGLGCEALLPETIDDFRGALRASWARNVPTLIELRDGSALARSLVEKEPA